MIVKLKKKRRPGAVIIQTAQGSLKWVEVGDSHEVSDDVGHKLVGDYPDMFEAGKKAAPKKAPKPAPENEEKQVQAEANKMAKEYVNK